MTSPLWRRIKRYVVSGRERPKVDLKRELDLSTKSNKAEFAKDVTAIANTSGGDGFIIIGVVDAKERQSDNPTEYVPGFRAPNGPDAFHIQMIDALTQFCNRVPTIEYDEIKHPDTDRFIGIVTIKRSAKRPHSLVRGSGDIAQHSVYVRRGTATYQATPEEIIEMDRKTALPPMTVINLSTHPLTDEQREQVQREAYIEELIEEEVQFEPTEDILPQIEKVIDSIGLTIEEWSGKSIGLVLPGIAPGAAALLAYIHGLRGGFPKTFWMDRHPDGSRYVVAQTIDLQGLRDQARKTRAALAINH